MTEFKRVFKPRKQNRINLDTNLWKFCVKCQKDQPVKGSKMIGPNMYICIDCNEKTRNKSNNI